LILQCFERLTQGERDSFEGGAQKVAARVVEAKAPRATGSKRGPVPNEGVGDPDHGAPNPDSTLAAGLRLLLWVHRPVSAFVRGLRLDVLEHGPVDDSVCVVRQRARLQADDVLALDRP
jgi:hypothetical protein